MKKEILVCTYLLFSFFISQAQITKVTPTNPTADESITVTLNTIGTPLANYTGDVYLHTGVNINTTSKWQYVKGNWGANTDQPKMIALGAGKYQYIYTPSLNNFFGVLSNEVITDLCIVFRSDDGSKKAEDNDFIFPIAPSGLNMIVQNPSSSPFYAKANSIYKLEGTANTAESISLFIDDLKETEIAGDKFTYNLTIANAGKHTLKFTSKKGSDTKSQEFIYEVNPSPTVAALPQGLKSGINYIDANSVSLVLHAPKKEFVYLLGDFNNWAIDNQYLMNKTPDGDYFWITISNLTAKTEYGFQYLIDGTLRVADPYAEKILDPDNDKLIPNINYPDLKQYPFGKTSQIVSILQTSQDQYPWSITNFSAPDQSKLMIYELLIRDFTSSGDINGVLEKLDYLKTLGINAIELMPINEFEGNDSWGYNPSFYFAADKAYGTRDAYKKLIDECHKKGIAVIIDMVLNHAKNSCPLVRMYADKNGNPTKESPWFNEIAPMSCYGAASWGADFNHERQVTKDFVDRVNKYWLTEFKIDGIRFDFTKGFSNNGSNCGGDYDASRIAILKRMYDQIKLVNPATYVILEHLVGGNEEVELSNYGIMLWGNMNEAYGKTGMKKAMGANFSDAYYANKGFTKPNLVNYMESHDEEREAFRVFNFDNYKKEPVVLTAPQLSDIPSIIPRLELNAAFFFAIPGPKMLWQFGELAYEVSIDYNGRVGKKPVKWEYLQVPERLRLYNIYSEWMNLRSKFDVFNSKQYTAILWSDTVKTIVLKSASMDAVVVGNFDQINRKAKPIFTKTGDWYEYFSGDTLKVSDVNVYLNLSPAEYRLYTSVKLDKNKITASPTARSLSITGKKSIGSTLTGKYSYFDMTGDLEDNPSFKWFTSYSPDGLRPVYRQSTTANYTITEADLDQYIFFEVTPLAKTGGILVGKPTIVGTSSIVVLGLSDIELAKIKIYPNPVVAQVNITLSNQISSVKIIDSNGRLLDEKKTKNETEIKFDLSSCNSGTYFILFYTNEGLAKTEKIIK